MGKKAITSRTHMKKIIPDCTKKFGKPKICLGDLGSEFKAVLLSYFKEQNIEMRNVRLVDFVERMNSNIGRYLRMNLQRMGFNEALPLTIKQLRNIKSRITNTRPSEVASGKVKLNKRATRSLKENPPARNITPFEKGQLIRHLLKKAREKGNLFYKSYAKNNYSVPKKVQNRMKLPNERAFKYKIDSKWYPQNEIIAVSDPIFDKKAPKPIQKLKMKLRSGKVKK